MKNSSGGYCYALCDANWKNSSKIIPQLYVTATKLSTFKNNLYSG